MIKKNQFESIAIKLNQKIKPKNLFVKKQDLINS